MQFRLPGDDEVFDLITSKLTFAEAKAIEKVAGTTMTKLMAMSDEDRPTEAVQATFWISIKRKRPTFKFVELEDVSIDEIEFLPESDSDTEMVEKHGADTFEVAGAGPTSPAPGLLSPEPSEDSRNAASST